MLRPATPLSILLFVAFVLLLLSVISTPIVKAIPLATFDGVDFGVFGHCKGSSCSGIQVGYSTGMFPPLHGTASTGPQSYNPEYLLAVLGMGELSML